LFLLFTVRLQYLYSLAEAIRDSRLELRVARSKKEVIERAAALSGSSTTDFVRSTMLVASELVVRAYETLALTSEGAAAIVEAITNPRSRTRTCGPLPRRRRRFRTRPGFNRGDERASRSTLHTRRPSSACGDRI
jgi:uncharacterized protein (DUF1778 family)